MNEISLRQAESSEAAAVASLINRAFEVERFFLERDRTDPEEISKLFETGRFLVAAGSCGLTGCVYVEKRGHRAYLGLLSIDPARQKSGLGARLAHAAEDYARSQGCQTMDLRIVNLREELPGFYRRLGYVETGTESFTPGVETKLPCNFIVMSKPLV